MWKKGEHKLGYIVLFDKKFIKAKPVINVWSTGQSTDLFILGVKGFRAVDKVTHDLYKNLQMSERSSK